MLAVISYCPYKFAHLSWNINSYLSVIRSNVTASKPNNTVMNATNIKSWNPLFFVLTNPWTALVTLFQDIPPLCVTQVKKSNGARSLELKAPLKEVVGDGFWSFLDQFGFHTRRTCHRRPLHPKEVLNNSIEHLSTPETIQMLLADWFTPCSYVF